MKKMRLQYRKTGTDADKMKGCIARMVGLAIRKSRRRLWYFSQKNDGHGRIISAHKKRSTDNGIKGQTRRGDWSFRSEYVRVSKQKKYESCATSSETSSVARHPKKRAGQPNLDKRLKPVSGKREVRVLCVGLLCRFFLIFDLFGRTFRDICSLVVTGRMQKITARMNRMVVGPNRLAKR